MRPGSEDRLGRAGPPKTRDLTPDTYVLVPVPRRGRLAEDDVHIATAVRAQQLRCCGTVGGDFQISHATEYSKHLAGCAESISGLDLGDLALADHDLESGWCLREQHGRVLRSDVGDEVSEAIDFEYHAAQRVLIGCLWFRGREAHEVGNFFPEFRRVDSLGKICSHRGKHVARMKRLAHR